MGKFSFIGFVILFEMVTAPFQVAWTNATAESTKVLVLVGGRPDVDNDALGRGRQLAMLLGHFDTKVTIKGVNEYTSNEMEGYNVIFYVGLNAHKATPAAFLKDVLSFDKKIVWCNSGFAEFSNHYPVNKRFGFQVIKIDSLSVFDSVRFGNQIFTKGEPSLNVIDVTNDKVVRVLATASSSKNMREFPYIVASGNFIYVADSPFDFANYTDRYLLFADMLHEILGEPHKEAHSALIRIEDVGPIVDPDQLRKIADMLSGKHIPFVVSVIPFYVDPSRKIHLNLSDKPKVIDALKYMVHRGAIIAMHGVTHQYKGSTPSDFEYWDQSTDAPIRGQTAESIAGEIQLGIREFTKNGLFPLVWETPHYTASTLLYQTVSQYFSTVIEQRLVIDDRHFGQFFPYVINKDLFGQTIYPENLGYITFDPDIRRSEAYVQKILRAAEVNLSVRDGFASCYFHPFLNVNLLRQLVDGIRQLGYTYENLAERRNWVKTKGCVILSGTQSYTVTLQNQFLSEVYFNSKGEPIKRSIAEKAVRKVVTKYVELSPGEIYKAELLDPSRRRKRSAASGLIR